jgi:mannose-6-phosphate isomerase-like protein (cupin superfamily)
VSVSLSIFEEEMFIVLEDSGTLRVAHEMLPIAAGEYIFVPPGPAYPIRSSASEQMPTLSNIPTQ